jgi:creatinine amidohydrolase
MPPLPTGGWPNAPQLRCKLANWFMAGPVLQEARSLYGDQEGHHATPSEIALTLHLEPSLQTKQRPLPEPAPAGPIHGPEDFRRRHPDGRMGSNPYLAQGQPRRAFPGSGRHGPGRRPGVLPGLSASFKA